MKTIKKALALVLTLAIVMSLGITAFAAKTEPTYSITVTNTPTESNVSIVGKEYTAYKLFDVKVTGNGENAEYAYTVNEGFKAFTLTEDQAKAIDADFDGKDLRAEEEQGTGDPIWVNNSNIIAFVGGLQNSEVYEFAAAVKANLPIAIKSSKGKAEALKEGETVEKAVIDCNDLGAGYYMVFGTAVADKDQVLTSALILDTINSEVEIAAKADAPKVTKTMGNDNVVDTTAEVGSTVSFTLKSAVPAMTGFKRYAMTFADTLSSGLTLKDETITAKINGREIVLTVVDSEDKINAEVDGAYLFLTKTVGETAVVNGFKVVFQNLKSQLTAKEADLEGSKVVKPAAITGEIVITYDAVINENALLTEVETNKATLSYSSNPLKPGDTEKPVGPGDPEQPEQKTTPEEKTRVFDFNLNINKQNADKPAETLKDAGFKLFKAKDAVADASTTIPAAENRDYYAFKENAVNWTTAGDTYYTASNGQLAVRTDNQDEDQAENPYKYAPTSFQGLQAGTYYLEEVEAPKGFQTPEYPLMVKVTENHPRTNVDEPATYDETKIESVTYTVYEYNGSKYVQKATATKALGDTVAVGNTSYVFDVLNSSANKLPSTGGVGTTIFYTVGTIMMVTALVLLITKKKMSVN